MDNEFSISKNNWNKIINYAAIAYDEFRAEIGGMAVVIEDSDGDWEIKDPIILKQIITAGNTHLDKDELAMYYTKTAKKYAKKNFRFCWWHSHHTMEAFWSGTDLSTIDEFNEGDFSFALVVNLKEEYKFRVSVWKPFEIHEDIELSIPENVRKVPNKMVDEVKELCNKPEVRSYGNMKEQPNLFNRYKYKSYRLGDNISTVSEVIDLTDDPNKVDYTVAYKLMEYLINGASDGTVKYDEYVQSIQEFNDKSAEQEAGILIGQLDQKSWEEGLLTTSPGNHIVDTEMDDYNQSFDYHARWGI